MSQCAAQLQSTVSPRIIGVQFGLLNPDKVRRMSVAAITTAALYARHNVVTGGMNDMRMGTSDRQLMCQTCRHDIEKCPGHFGHMDLAVPMYHVSMLPIVLKILRCVCIMCSELLVCMEPTDERLVHRTGKQRLTFVSDLCKSQCKNRRKCPSCGIQQPKYVYSRSTTSISLDTTDITFEDDEEEAAMNRPFTPARARVIMSHISDKNVEIMGGCPVNSRPEWMVLTVIQIPPPISRPCITASDGSRTKGQDDVTVKLIEIFKANKAVDKVLRTAGCVSGFMPTPVAELDARHPWDICANLPPDNTKDINSASDILQQHLVQYFPHSSSQASGDQKLAGMAGRMHSRALRLIPDRWKGKKGRFRGNLGGKRVDFSSRTVASPSPDLDIDEVGIPRRIANHLTFPERVTRFNVKMLTECVLRGSGVTDGATTVIIPGSDPIDLSLCTERDALMLEDGWVVERHLMNGDWVLLNRQPSLHRMSIMAHRVHIVEDDTFRLPVCDTTPYNADFDGDELNVHVLQTHDARAEASELMSVTTQMVSPENNKPIIALVQDSLVAAFLMTQRDTFLRRDQVMQLLMSLRYLPHGLHMPPPAVMKPTPLWTGKQVFSLMFPDAMTYRMVVRSGTGDVFDPEERCVVVRYGEIMCGSLCKKTLGTSAGGIVHVLIRDWGLGFAGKFVGDAQRLLRDYMMIRGFSVGVGDCVMPASTHKRVNSVLAEALDSTDALQSASSRTSLGVVDGCVSKRLGSVLTCGGAEVVKDVNVHSGNNVAVMVESGAKGSAINISQILSCVGQQNVEGGRIRQGVDNRTLPCYRHGDNSAGARGFVCNSYGTGLTAQEYFFPARGGREGLVDTAVKTASTGYIQRRLSKAQEGLQVRYESTVRNTSGDMIQFRYGGDGYYPTELERTRYVLLPMDNATLRAYVVGKSEEWEGVVGSITLRAWLDVAEHQLGVLTQDRDMVRATQLALFTMADQGMVVPCRPDRMMEHAVCKFRDDDCVPIHPRQVLSHVDKLFERVSASLPDHAVAFTCAYLRSHLTLRNMVVVNRLGPAAVEWVCHQLWRQFSGALAPPGEMVGTLGASSIGAPCTQMVCGVLDCVCMLFLTHIRTYSVLADIKYLPYSRCPGPHGDPRRAPAQGVD